MTQEEWRPVIGYEGWYEVSNLGRVRSLDRTVMNRFWPTPKRNIRIKGCLLRPGTGRAGYSQVVLNRDGHKRGVTVHILVAEAFLGPRPHPSFDCCHNDSNPANNAASNLRWGSKASNYADAVAAGTAARGEKHPKAVLTEAMVRLIRTLESQFSRRELGNIFGVSAHQIWMVQKRRSWCDA